MFAPHLYVESYMLWNLSLIFYYTGMQEDIKTYNSLTWAILKCKLGVVWKRAVSNVLDDLQKNGKASHYFQCSFIKTSVSGVAKNKLKDCDHQ